MAFDALTLSILKDELAEFVVGGKISKIYQPEKDEILLAIYNKTNFRLLISANATVNRIHLTEKSTFNPQTAPAFCMLLRKHISNAQITGIWQQPYERVLDFTLQTKSELGYDSTLHLIFELTGKTSNIILTNEKYIVIDCLKHLPQDLKSTRFVVKGLKYEFFAPQNKLKIDEIGKIELLLSQSSTPLRQLLLDNLLGVSASTVKEILTNIDENNHSDLNNQRVIQGILRYLEGIKNKKPNVVHLNNRAVDVNPFDYLSVRGNKQFFDTLNQAHDNFYFTVNRTERLNSKAKSVSTIVKNAISRTEKKLAIQRQSILDSQASDQNKILGDLILANIHLINSTKSSVVVCNFYDTNCPDVEIPLEVGSTPQQNAQKYYKKYRKQKSTIEHNSILVKENEKILEYLLTVQQSLKFCTEISDIEQIALELTQAGFIKVKKQQNGKKVQQNLAFRPLQYKISGFEVFVGKNNLQNNEVTFKIAKPNDLWLHTRKIHSSHIAIVTNGKEVPDQVLLCAAEICAYFSQARSGSKIAVDYTQKINVKKPSKAPLGFVVYSNFSTIVVDPNEHQEFLV